MHVVIGFLSAVAGLVWAFVALQRAGLDLNALNPFLWYRRHQWMKKYGEKPVYKIADPMEVSALLLLAMAKCEGEVSAEQKQVLKRIFRDDFHLPEGEADDLLVASAFLLRDEVYLVDNIDKVLQRSGPCFTAAQVRSLTTLLKKVARIEGSENEEQRKLTNGVESWFARAAKSGAWKG